MCSNTSPYFAVEGARVGGLGIKLSGHGCESRIRFATDSSTKGEAGVQLGVLHDLAKSIIV